LHKPPPPRIEIEHEHLPLKIADGSPDNMVPIANRQYANCAK